MLVEQREILVAMTSRYHLPVLEKHRETDGRLGVERFREPLVDLSHGPHLAGETDFAENQRSSRKR